MIVTARGRWILAVAVTAALLGVLNERLMVSRLGLAILAWMGLEWLAFRYWADSKLRGTGAERVVADHGGAVRTLWENRVYAVQVRITLPRSWSLAYADLSERIPLGAEMAGGIPSARVLLGRQGRVTLRYSLRPIGIGVMRMEGIGVVMADLHGLFYVRRFLPVRQHYRVLPPLIEAGTPTPVHKRHNQLPPPGMHAHLRPGMGSELMEIRDYIPGDPPRTVAWKISARRDCLMTKQYESEVPVRCTLMVDVSRSVRLGYPGPTPLHTLIRLAATMAETLVANRDPVGLNLFGPNRVHVIRAAANRQTTIRILTKLAEAVGRPLEPVEVPSDELLPQAVAMTSELYPRQLEQITAALSGFRLWPRSRRKTQRMQLAAVVTSYFGLGSGMLAELIQNDQSLSFHLQRFLAEHQVPYPGPLYDRQGHDPFSDAEKIQSLTKLLTRAVSRGHDNELFVLMADLLELDDRLSPLLKAVKVATARHHRVVVVCAWPPGMRPPSERSPDVPNRMSGMARSAIVETADRQARTTAYRALRRQMAKLRVPVVCAADSVAIRLLLTEIELLRTGRMRK